LPHQAHFTEIFGFRTFTATPPRKGFDARVPARAAFRFRVFHAFRTIALLSRAMMGS
jgi:hypothetical protein